MTSQGGTPALVVLGAIAVAACASAPRVEPPVVVPVAMPSKPEPGRGLVVEPSRVDVEPGTSIVVVQASRAASRQPESPRLLRKLLASRHGQLEIASGYPRVSLIIESVVSGTLDDPDYAKRPIGVNVLPVVLVDEAAFAAPDSLDGFDGRWRLTRRADGTLIAGAIGDTPFAAKKAAERSVALDRTRSSLRASTPEERLAGLDDLDKHLFYDLVPDVIALLDDTRSEQPRPQSHGHVIHLPRVVRDIAETRLRRILAPFAFETIPSGSDRRAWESFWQAAVSANVSDSPPVIAPSTIVESLPISSSQSFADIAATHDGVFLYGVSGLSSAVDGHTNGIAFGRPGEKRVWVSPQAREGLDVVSGPLGFAGVFASFDGPWTVAVAGPGLASPKSTTLAPDAAHCAIGASPTGFVLVHTKKDSSSIFALALDGSGKPRGPAKEVKLPSPPETQYHRLVHPIGITRKPNGWLVTVEGASHVWLVSLDDSFAVANTTRLGDRESIAQPKVAVAKDRAFVVWTHDGLRSTSTFSHVVTDLLGQRLSDVGTTGSEIQAFSHPIALDDGGFALAWVETSRELHLARWSAKGEPVANVLLQAKEVLQSPIALGRDARGFLVASVDTTRYPYALVVRRVDPSVVK